MKTADVERFSLQTTQNKLTADIILIITDIVTLVVAAAVVIIIIIINHHNYYNHQSLYTRTQVSLPQKNSAGALYRVRA